MRALAKVLSVFAILVGLLVGFVGVNFYGFAPKRRLPATVTAPRTPEAVERGRDGRILYVMPWTAYTGMTEADARAIVAALRTIPAVGTPVAKRSFKE